jgi:general stress protein 26
MDEKTTVEKEVWAHLKDFQHVSLATAEGVQPRVRPMSLVYLDGKCWCMTNTKSMKVKQIQKNPKVEFCLFLQEKGSDGYIRVAGAAKIITGREKKSRIANYCSFFGKHFKGVDDPDYTLIEISPVEIEYLRPGEFKLRKFKP